MREYRSELSHDASGIASRHAVTIGTATLVLSILVAGCDNNKKAAENAATPATSSSATNATSPSPVASGQAIPAAPPAPNGANNPSVDPMATMFGTMATEAKNRPNVHPSADDAFAALDKAGVGVKEPKQSVGKTYKAAYCSHGLTPSKDLSVLLCEYPDAAAAAAGLAESKKLFVGLVTRETMANKTLLLVTIFQDEKHPASTTAAQQKVVSTFKAL